MINEGDNPLSSLIKAINDATIEHMKENYPELWEEFNKLTHLPENVEGSVSLELYGRAKEFYNIVNEVREQKRKDISNL